MKITRLVSYEPLITYANEVKAIHSEELQGVDEEALYRYRDAATMREVDNRLGYTTSDPVWALIGGEPHDWKARAIARWS